MENLKNQPQKALVMSFDEWQKNKKWLLQYPGVFCNPVIEQLERYLVALPIPGSTPDPAIPLPARAAQRNPEYHHPPLGVVCNYAFLSLPICNRLLPTATAYCNTTTSHTFPTNKTNFLNKVNTNSG